MTKLLSESDQVASDYHRGGFHLLVQFVCVVCLSFYLFPMHFSCLLVFVHPPIAQEFSSFPHKRGIPRRLTNCREGGKIIPLNAKVGRKQREERRKKSLYSRLVLYLESPSTQVVWIETLIYSVGSIQKAWLEISPKSFVIALPLL